MLYKFTRVNIGFNKCVSKKQTKNKVLIFNRIFDQEEDFRFFINKIKEMELTKLSLILTG